MAYKDLPLKERHAFIRECVANGVHNLRDIEAMYNSSIEHLPEVEVHPQANGGYLAPTKSIPNTPQSVYFSSKNTSTYGSQVPVHRFEEGGPKYKQSSEAYYDPQSDTVFAPDSVGEFWHHERFHARPNAEYLQKIAPYYENLNDSVLTSFGADLSFVKRNGDPGQYYSPEEIGARVAASLEMLKKAGITSVSKDFITKSRKNENQYGDNYRDLLHMYNDDILLDLFNQYAKGGSIHIAPSKRGTFTAAATKHGKSVQAFASQVLAHKENYSPAMVRKANFARNSARWHADGGSNWLPDFTYNPSIQSDNGRQLVQSVLQDEGIQKALQQKALQRQAEIEAQRKAVSEIYNGMPNPGAGYVSGTDPLLQAVVDMTPAGDAEMATEAASELRNGNLKEAGILGAALLLPNLFNKYILKKTLKDNTGLIKLQNSVKGSYPSNFYYESASDLLKRLKAEGYDLSGIDADKLIQARLETLLNSNQGNRLMLFDGSTIKALDVGNIKSADDYYIRSSLIDKSSGEGLVGKLKLYKEKDNSYHPIMIHSWKPRTQVGRDLYDAAQQAAMEQGMNGSVLAERLLMPEKTVGTLKEWFPNKEIISRNGVWDILSADGKSRITTSGYPVYRLNGVERPSNLKHIVFDPSIVDENGIMHLGDGMYHSTGGPLYPFSFDKPIPSVRYSLGGHLFQDGGYGVFQEDTEYETLTPETAAWIQQVAGQQKYARKYPNTNQRGYNAEFWDRLTSPTILTIDDWEHKGSVASHKLSYAEADGKYYVYPEVQMVNGKLIDYTNPKNKGVDAFRQALSSNNYIVAPNEQIAANFTKAYKQYPAFTGMTQFRDLGNLNDDITYHKNPKKIDAMYNAIIKAGYSPVLASGIIGSALVESGMNEYQNEKGNSGQGYGLMQWTDKTRKANLAAYKPKGVKTEFERQVGFMLEELKDPNMWVGGKKSIEEFMHAKTVEDAVRIFAEKYEHPKDAHMDRRVAVGKLVYGQKTKKK